MRSHRPLINRNRKLSLFRLHCTNTRDRDEKENSIRFRADTTARTQETAQKRNTPFDSEWNSCSCQHYTVWNPRYCGSALLAPNQQQVLPRLQSRLSIHKRRKTKQNCPIDSELHSCILQHYSFLKSDHQAAVGTCTGPLGRCSVVAQWFIKRNRKLSPCRQHCPNTRDRAERVHSIRFRPKLMQLPTLYSPESALLWISLWRYQQALPRLQTWLAQSYAITGSCCRSDFTFQTQ